MKTSLEVHDVKKAYRLGNILVPALREVSFDVKEGETATISGAFWQGRSTLLHLCA